jgi:hypothetical protein
MRKYEELRSQLKDAEQSAELQDENDALNRAVSAVENLMMGRAKPYALTRNPKPEPQPLGKAS